MKGLSIYKGCEWLDSDLVKYDNKSKRFGCGRSVKRFVMGVNIGL